jgi:nitroreductase
MDVFEAIWTTRAMRRIDPDREVSDDDILKCIEAATKGPNGASREDARFVVARDPEVKQRVAKAYQNAGLEGFRTALANAGDNERVARLARSGLHLAEHLAETPALIIPCAEGPPGKHAPSVYPGVMNLFLAARALGLGTAMTTVHLRNEAEMKAALGIPDEVSTYCLIPIGYPLGRWGEAKRQPVREVTHWNGWDGPPPPAQGV